MAEVIWTVPALADSDAIADYIALDDRVAAKGVISRVFEHVGQLESHPESGPRVPELKKSRYRQLSESPCRIFYRYDGEKVFILHIMRGERLLTKGVLAARNRSARKSP